MLRRAGPEFKKLAKQIRDKRTVEFTDKDRDQGNEQVTALVIG